MTPEAIDAINLVADALRGIAMSVFIVAVVLMFKKLA